MKVVLAIISGFLMVGSAESQTYRIRGLRFTEEDIRAQHELVKEMYVMNGGQVVRAEQVGAFSVSFKIDRVVEPRIAVGKATGPVKPLERPDSAPAGGARTGKQFTIAETDASVLADISKGAPFALRLQKPAANMPLTGKWELMLVDSMTYLDRVKRGRIKGEDLGKLRVLYDVTIDFEKFVDLLQRGHVFPELENRK